MSTSYRQLAQLYDRLMVDAPYEDWVRFAESEWARYGIKPEKVMDLACGTGNISILLARRGYDVTGVDLSEEMLAIAEQKARSAGARVRLYRQDMSLLQAPEKMDCVVCFCDSLNYLIDPRDVEQTFASVYRALRPGGIFLFDVHSLYKIREIFGNETFHWVDDDLVYIWDCQLEESDEIYHFLTFFAKEDDGLYRRFEETHVQRGYSAQQLQTWLVDAGFVNIRLQADFQNEPPVRSSERLFFSCQKRS